MIRRRGTNDTTGADNPDSGDPISHRNRNIATGVKPNDASSCRTSDSNDATASRSARSSSTVYRATTRVQRNRSHTTACGNAHNSAHTAD